VLGLHLSARGVSVGSSSAGRASKQLKHVFAFSGFFPCTYHVDFVDIYPNTILDLPTQLRTHAQCEPGSQAARHLPESSFLCPWPLESISQGPDGISKTAFSGGGGRIITLNFGFPLVTGSRPVKIAACCSSVQHAAPNCTMQRHMQQTKALALHLEICAAPNFCKSTTCSANVSHAAPLGACSAKMAQRQKVALRTLWDQSIYVAVGIFYWPHGMLGSLDKGM
jgi:hypothetical protein